MEMLIRLTIIVFLLFISSGNQLVYADDSTPTIARVVWIKGVFTATSAEQKMRVLK